MRAGSILFWVFLGFLAIAVAAWCCRGSPAPPRPPLPPKIAKPKVEVTQGAGAAALIVKEAVIPPPPKTNVIKLESTIPRWAPGDQPFVGMFILYVGDEHRLMTNYFEWQAKWECSTNWVVIGRGVSNRWTVVSTKSNAMFRCRYFLE